MKPALSGKTIISGNILYGDGAFNFVGNLSIAGPQSIQLLGMSVDFIDGMIGMLSRMRNEAFGPGRTSGALPAEDFIIQEVVIDDYWTTGPGEPVEQKPELTGDELADYWTGPSISHNPAWCAGNPCKKHAAGPGWEPIIPPPEDPQDRLHAPWCDSGVCIGCADPGDPDAGLSFGDLNLLERIAG